MPERQTKVQVVPNGPLVDGFDVPLRRWTEQWCEAELEDGTSVRIKPVVVAIIRVKDQYDQEGNPVYVFKGGMAIALQEVPPKLRDPNKI